MKQNYRLQELKKSFEDYEASENIKTLYHYFVAFFHTCVQMFVSRDGHPVNSIHNFAIIF